MKAKNILLFILGVFIFASCSQELDDEALYGGSIDKIYVNLPEFESETRTTITADENGVKYVWAKKDTIGIFPSEGFQVPFSMANGAGTTSAKFTGGGWGLKSSSTYSAYFPLKGEFYLDRTQISVDYTNQKQEGNNSTAHLGNYDFLATPASSAKNGIVSFNFQRLGCLVMLEIDIPTKGKIESVTLMSDEEIFTQKGTIDLSATTPAITATQKSKTFEIKCQNITTSAASPIAKVYWMMAPANLEGKTLKAKLVINGAEKIITLGSKNFVAGKAYKLICSEEDINLILPDKELRGVWMATVWGLDWPKGKYDATTQKEFYTHYLDLLKECNMNAVFFQVRGMADAFYESQYEPWCKNITGNANIKPSYDVMNFLIDEAHKRGIQFHAWINPYRIATRADKAHSFAALDSRIPKEWTKDYNKIRVYNPALPEVQQRIVDIVTEIITKYDVDGIHMDDYFYPELEKGESMNDDNEYAKYGSRFSSIKDFRRNNVNVTIQNIQNAILANKPEVIFSVAPGGNIDHNSNDLYADTKTWSQNGWVDVMIPQLYFATGTGTYSFNTCLNRWSQQTYNSHLMIGYGIYKFGNSAYGNAYLSSDELDKQFAYANKDAKVEGGVLYSARDLDANKVSIRNAIKKEYNKKALIPYLSRCQAVAPKQPENLQCSNNELTWSAVSNAVQYAVYKSNGNNKIADLIGITTQTSFSLKESGAYVVTALSKSNAESAVSNMVEY